MRSIHFYALNTEEGMAELGRDLLGSCPSPSAMWDARLYTTHAPILSRAVNADDLLSDSNYECALASLQGSTGEYMAPDAVDLRFVSVNHDDDYSMDVIDARISDWAWGPLDQLFVRVFEPCGGLTDAWVAACKILDRLSDYPVLDVSDWSERECEAIDASFADASHRAWVRTGTSEAEHAGILSEMKSSEVMSVLWDVAREAEYWVCPDEFEDAYRDAARRVGVVIED